MMKSWAKFTQNSIVLYFFFFFIENLTFPSSIYFSINMEGSRRSAARIGHFSSLTETSKKKNKKYITLWQNVFCPTIHQIALSSFRLQLVRKLVTFVAEMKQFLYLHKSQGLYTTRSSNLCLVNLTYMCQYSNSRFANIGTLRICLSVNLISFHRKWNKTRSLSL